MNTIPAEVKNLIISKLTEKRDLANARLVSKAISEPATRRLFSKKHLTLHCGGKPFDDLPEDSGSEGELEVLNNLQNILSVPHLVSRLRTLRYSISSDENKSLDDYLNDDKPSKLTSIGKAAIHLLKQFPNSTNPELEFACVCATIGLRITSKRAQKRAPSSASSSSKLYSQALSNLSHPTPNFTSLSIKNLQNYNDKRLVRSDGFLSVLSRISKPRLKIVTEHNEASPESAYASPQMQDFMTQLPGT